jgi:hypothetical protein
MPCSLVAGFRNALPLCICATGLALIRFSVAAKAVVAARDAPSMPVTMIAAVRLTFTFLFMGLLRISEN